MQFILGAWVYESSMTKATILVYFLYFGVFISVFHLSTNVSKQTLEIALISNSSKYKKGLARRRLEKKHSCFAISIQALQKMVDARQKIKLVCFSPLDYTSDHTAK